MNNEEKNIVVHVKFADSDINKQEPETIDLAKSSQAARADEQKSDVVVQGAEQQTGEKKEEVHPSILNMRCYACNSNGLRWKYHLPRECGNLDFKNNDFHIHFFCQHPNCACNFWRPSGFWREEKIGKSTKPIETPEHIKNESCPACNDLNPASFRACKAGTCWGYDGEHMHFTCECGWEWRRPIAWWKYPEDMRDLVIPAGFRSKEEYEKMLLRSKIVRVAWITAIFGAGMFVHWLF